MGEKKDILKQLEKFMEKLKEKIQINRFIFFGSRALGIPDKDSDIDLIIVSENFKGKKFRFRAIGFYDFWNLDYPVDFLCYTPDEFNKLKNQVTIVKEAVEKGIEIT